MRNMIDEMRSARHVMRGPSGFTARNRQDFANQLDRWLARVKKATPLKSPGPDSREVLRLMSAHRWLDRSACQTTTTGCRPRRATVW